MFNELNNEYSINKSELINEDHNNNNLNNNNNANANANNKFLTTTTTPFNLTDSLNRSRLSINDITGKKNGNLVI